RQTKNRRPREWPFAAHPELCALMTAQQERTQALQRALGRVIPTVFHRDGKPIADFADAWETACKGAGVPGILFHDLRRSAVRNLINAGVPQSVAMQLTG